jgi:predicted nucleic acid-binding protein
MSLLLNDDKIVLHPFVVGEIALGNLKNRKLILGSLRKFQALAIAQEHDVLDLIENYGLFGLGIGYVDSHLLASSVLANARLWTSDKKLAAAAQKLNVSI